MCEARLINSRVYFKCRLCDHKTVIYVVYSLLCSVTSGSHGPFHVIIARLHTNCSQLISIHTIHLILCRGKCLGAASFCINAECVPDVRLIMRSYHALCTHRNTPTLY